MYLTGVTLTGTARGLPSGRIADFLPRRTASGVCQPRRIGVTLLLAAELVLSALAATASGQTLESRLVIVQSSGSAGKLDHQRLAVLVQQACAELHVDASAVPQIVFIRLSGAEAHVGGVPAGAALMVERAVVTIERQHASVPPRFLVWMVGAPSDSKIVAAVVHVLAQHLQLDLSEADLASAERRILLRLGATVDVHSFH